MFFANYDIPNHQEQNKEHVFTFIRNEMRDYVDTNIYGIQSTPTTTAQSQSTASSTNNTANVGAASSSTQEK